MLGGELIEQVLKVHAGGDVPLLPQDVHHFSPPPHLLIAAPSANLEDLFDQLATKHDIAIFCSFLMDNFNGDVHAHMLPRLGTNHSHLVPVEHYARLERAVADALRETVGADEARVLEGQLLSQYRQPFAMPRAQALLLALRQVLPAVATPVLVRSRELYTASAAG